VLAVGAVVRLAVLGLAHLQLQRVAVRVAVLAARVPPEAMREGARHSSALVAVEEGQC
jgi:hypothetical protein